MQLADELVAIDSDEELTVVADDLDGTLSVVDDRLFSGVERAGDRCGGRVSAPRQLRR